MLCLLIGVCTILTAGVPCYGYEIENDTVVAKFTCKTLKDLSPGEIYSQHAKDSDPNTIHYTQYAVDKAGNIYLPSSNPFDNIVYINKYDIKSNLWQIFKTNGYVYLDIADASIDTQGNIYVAAKIDPNRKYVVMKFDDKGVLVQEIGESGINEPPQNTSLKDLQFPWKRKKPHNIFGNMLGIHIDEQNNLYVVENYSHRSKKYDIKKYDSKGTKKSEQESMPEKAKNDSKLASRVLGSIESTDKREGYYVYPLIGNDGLLYYWFTTDSNDYEIHRVRFKQ